ncbi:protein FAR-RED IMPAIRED RESPONSE 1-like [Camellia sinensis]|uniref:protein FAR-RED IMPAIRED RESPONSE 1-like n=1 Tax=Camellia sinensis TaxID=4442 RepID=UPI001035F944|nr:protein FAR-RED IMPAIRED RESPONSE 1-like [Camellia sinensis]
MQNAIEIVFSQARYRWCLWHIMKKILEKLRGYSQYVSIKVALSNAVYDSFTKDEFEEYLEAMIENFNLNDNEWLGVLYCERYRWILAYVKDIFWAGISTTQRSESMNAFFDGYVNSKTTLKQFVEQYDNALRSKVENETKADFKSRNKLYDCLTAYRFEKQFRIAYTNSKFKEVQLEMKHLVYCRANLIKEKSAICTYHVREAIIVGEGMKKVEFVVYFNSTECELQCMCRLFEFRELATNDDGKHKVIQLGLMKIKDEVGIVQSSSASNVSCTSTLPPSSSTLLPFHTSPKSPPRINTTKESMARKVLSSLVARRRGRPCTKRKVSKVNAIVNRLKEKNKKANPGQKVNLVPPNQPYYFPRMDATQDSMYVPAPVSTIGDDIRSTSHTQAGMVNNISSQSSIVPSNFVDLNIDGDPNIK